MEQSFRASHSLEEVPLAKSAKTLSKRPGSSKDVKSKEQPPVADFDVSTVYGEDPLKVARRWLALGATRLHLVERRRFKGYTFYRT